MTAPARTVAIVAALLAAQFVAVPGVAQDTGAGVDMQFGNRLDPTGGQWLNNCDPRGGSWLTADLRRTPTGFLYLCPTEAPPLSEAGDWLYGGSIPVGAVFIGGDEQNAQWLRYSGWDDGLVLGPFSLQFFRPDDGSYVDFRGSRLNADNQYYKVSGGRAGDFRVEAFLRDQPNVVSANARSIWDGIGTARLTLVDGLTPAGSTPVEVTAAMALAPERRLEVQRDKLGLGVTYFFNREWTGYLNGAQEERNGSRPFGGPFFFNFPFPSNGGILEIPRLIDDVTTSMNGGLRFVGGDWRMEFAYAGSFYRSEQASYSYETPYALTPVIPGAVSPALYTGEFASEPDNDYHNVRANLTRKIPWNGELSLTASRGQMRQNDPLLAPINCQGQFGIDLSPTGAPANPFLFDCADWNTPAALSRTRADLTIETTMLAARMVLQPTRRITWRGDLRYDKQDYDGDYFAFNPLTNQYGYIAENGAQGSVVPGEMGVWDATLSPSVKTRIRNLPLDKDTVEAALGADLRMSDYDTLGATYTYTRTEREHREVHAVEDNSLRLTWANRRLERVTFRANYTYLNRTGDDYNYDPYEFTFSTSLPDFVPPAGGVPAHTVDALRKFDVARRDQHKINLMATFAVQDNMTLSATVRADLNDYSGVLGRTGYDTRGATLQWEWQPTPQTAASVWYGYDHSKLSLANVNDAAVTADPTLGGTTYPLASRWWVDDTQRNQYLGITLDQQVYRARLEFNGTYSDARGSTDFSYASPAALAWPATAGMDGSAFPAMTNRVTSLSLGLYLPVTDRVAIRIFDRYERGHLFDWHYSGFEQQQVYDHRVYTDGGPESYSVNLIGLMFEVRL